MTATSKISSCVDCSTPIIGELLRCPACHDRHAAPKPMTTAQSLAAWLVAVLIVAGTVALLALAGRSCQ